MLSYHFEGVPRTPLAVALKNILTLGIHTKVWLYRVNREMDGHEGFHIDLRWLGVMVVVPFLTPIVVKFQTARRLNQMVSHQVTVPLIRASTLGWVSIIPVFGAGFYAWWVQSTLNQHWFHHRREERIRLARDKIASISAEAEPTPETLAKKQRLEAEVADLEREIVEEIEAARIRWGEERFADRKKRADLHASQGARMSRTELAKLRKEAKAHRKAEKARKKATRGRFFGLLPAKAAPSEDAAAPDPDDDADWEPQTPLPERMPEEIEALAAGEDRELAPEEQKELKAAKKQLAKREKEALRLEKERAKLRETREKLKAKAERQEAKDRIAAEKAAKKQKAKPEKVKPEKTKDKKKGKKPKAEKKGKGEKEAPPTPIPVEVKPRRLRAPPTVHEAGEGPLRTLTVNCPRCRTEIEGIRKRGDAPAKITCPTCHLVGKI